MRTLHSPNLSRARHQFDLTELEILVLNELLHDEFNALNGGRIEADTDLDDLNTWGGDAPTIPGLKIDSIKGAMGSLAAKGFIKRWSEHHEEYLDFDQRSLQIGIIIDAEEQA